MRTCRHCHSPATVVAITSEGATDLCSRHDAAVRALHMSRLVIVAPTLEEPRP